MLIAEHLEDKQTAARGKTESDIRKRRSMVEKSLGDYLVASGVCEEATVEQLLLRQQELRAKGYDAFIGRLLLDAGVISVKDLSQALKQQDIDRLATSTLFHTLPLDMILTIQEKAVQRFFQAGEVIFRQGDASDFVYIIMQGAVNQSHRPPDSGETDVAVLRSGEFFGEMSLIASSTRFTSAKAIEPTRVLGIPRDFFLNLYRSYPQLTEAAAQRWFKIIVDGKLESQVYQEQHHRELLSRKKPQICAQILGNSRRAEELRKHVESLAHSRKPALIVGEPGTMKSRVGQAIFSRGPDRDGSLIVFDPLAIPPFIAAHLDSGLFRAFEKEVMQLAALFGLAKAPYDSGMLPWQGFLKASHNGAIVIRNVDSLEPKVQRLLAQYIKRGFFHPVGAENPSSASTRIIATAADDLDIDGNLLECFASNTVRLPSLGERKKDLKEIVSLLIADYAGNVGKQVDGIDGEAMNMIMAYQWPGNFRELETVIQRAVNLAKGPVLTTDDIFLGQVPVTGKRAYNLLKIRAVNNFFLSPFYPNAPRIVIAFLFLLVVALGIWGNPSPDSNISLLLVWANWEPLLILSCLFLARLWCSLCPIGFLSEQFEKVRLGRFTVPTVYLNYGYYLSAAGLAVIFWSQTALDMWQRPKETAGLLIAILSCAILFSLFFEGRIWCRYICPLGQMVATFARASVVEIRSNVTYCGNQCRSYDCYSGKENTPGCPMAKGPFALETNHNCTLCGNCIKNCPNQSVRLNLRPPGWELWNVKSADLAALLFVPLLWGTQLFRGLDTTTLPRALSSHLGSEGLAYALLMVLSAAFAYHVAIAGVAFIGGKDTVSRGEHGARFVFAMLPLVYAIEIAHRLVPLLNHAAEFFVILGNQIGYEIPHVAFRLDMQSIHILQIILVGVGMLVAQFVLEKLVEEGERHHGAVKFFRQLPLAAMAVISVILL